jgi:very-short-patch-repair endonuclease
VTLEELLERHKPMEWKVMRQRKKELNSKRFPSEIWLERYLISNGVKGYRRNLCLQGRFFGDFVFRNKKLVVEVDGSSHNGKEEYDKSRDLLLSHFGYTVIRIKYKDESALPKIIQKIKQASGVRKSKLVERSLSRARTLSTNQIRKHNLKLKNIAKIREYEAEKKRHLQIIEAKKKPRVIVRKR